MLDRRWRARVEQALDPLGRGLHNRGVSADGLTLFGLAVAVGTGLLIANGNLLLAVFGVILTGLPDVLDGSVARHSGTAGSRGAFFDSVCDRVADAALLLGVAWHLTSESPELPVLTMAVLGLTMLITYERARAESLGYSARGGLMERAERMVLLGVGLAFDVLVPMLWVMLALTAITALHRFVMVWRQANAATAPPAGAPAPTDRDAGDPATDETTAVERGLRPAARRLRARHPRTRGFSRVSRRR
jgi:CDP-diacylglycerol--glycerol-3-phosphate 3-phosphatidyltransferase